MPIQRVDAQFENLGDSDWFRVRLVAGQTYQVRISSPNQGATMRVLGPDGQALPIPIAFANVATFVAPVTGDYFIAATADGGPIPVFYSITVEDIPDVIPASVATPATLAVGETQTVPANNAGGITNNDWFAIDLVAGQSYVLATSNITGRVYFADAGGAVVAIEGFFAGGGQQAHFTATETGRFYAGTQHSSSTSYQLSLLAIADDHGDRPADAGGLTVGTPANGRWESGGDDDAYAVVLTAGSSYNFAVQNLTDSQYGYLRILDESGSEVWSSYGQAAFQTTVFSPDVDGTYYAIAALNSVSSPTGPPAYLKGWDYALSATLLTGELTDNALTTGALTAGGQAAGTWEGPGDRDWLKIDLVGGQSYLFTLATSAWNGVGLALFNADGNQVHDTTLSTPSGSQLQHTAAATGSYFISALVGMFPGSYTIAAAAVADDFADHAGTTGQVVNGIGIGVSENFADTDWFAVELVAGLSYKLEGGGSGVGLAVRDADGTLLTQPWADLTFTPSATGIYFVEAGGADGDYAFLIAPAADDYLESLATTGVIRLEVLGTNGADILTSTDTYEHFVGGGGDDLFIASTGYDLFEGGGGSDTVSYGSLGEAIEVDLRVARSLVDGVPRDLLLVENVVGSAFDDLIIGSGAANRLDGGAGNDIIMGEGGLDLLIGGAGADMLTGGTGDDSYLVEDSGDRVFEVAGGGYDTVYTIGDYALNNASYVEALTVYDRDTTNAVILFGNNLGNVIYGNQGNNTLYGGGGTDTFYGLGGDDGYLVDDLSDQVFEVAGAGYDTVYSTGDVALNNASFVEALSVYDRDTTNALTLFGNNLNNVIYGNQGSNALLGGGGEDTLYGLGGDDRYFVDSLGDQVIEVAGGGTDTVYTTLGNYQLITDQSVETLTVYDRDTTYAATLIGNNLAQFIYGNAGTNNIDGKGGADTLYGMAGADTFTFTNAPLTGAADALADFSATDDTIALDDQAFLGVGGPGALGANAFVIGSAAADADDRIVYNQATGQLFFDADGTGAGAQVLFATVNAGTVLSASDFTVI